MVDAPGANLLIAFAGIAEAAQCAVGLQHELAAKNAELSEERRMRFRIGSDLGDVMEKDVAFSCSCM